jgi:hypothetical protein
MRVVGLGAFMIFLIIRLEFKVSVQVHMKAENALN